MFAQGQAAAARLVRALAAPDRTVQIAIAKVLIDAGKQANAAIVANRLRAYEQERWTPGEPEAQTLPDLRRWYEGPDALGTESVDYMSITVPV